MRYDARGAGQPSASISASQGHAEHVVDVPVRVDGGVQAGRTPTTAAPRGRPWPRGRPGVDEEEAVLGGERRHVGEGRDEADAVADLDEATEVVEGV